MRLDAFSLEDGKAMCGWQYPPPYDDYTMPPWETVCSQSWGIADPALRERQFHALRQEDGALMGFFRLVPGEDAVTIGLGLRPDLCGQGLGQTLLAEACAACAREYPQLSLRLEVRAWNQRAIRCYTHAGFTELRRFTRETPAGSREFAELRRPGAGALLEELLQLFPQRKKPLEKAALRRWLTQTLTAAGYQPTAVTSGLLRGTNLIIGDPEQAKLLLTAHYDTCTASGIPNCIAPKRRLATLLYQLLRRALMLAPVWGVLLLLRWLGLSWLWTAAGSAVTLLLLGVYQLFGPANPSNRNDNTSGVAVVLETLLALPVAQRQLVCGVFFDQEEYGSLGSRRFHWAHPHLSAPLLNFDCVGDGDLLLFMGSARVRQDPLLLARLEAAFSPTSGKQVEVSPQRRFYPSDHINFPMGIGVAAFRQVPVLGAVLGRIHTPRDVRFDQENLRLLCRGCLRLIALCGGGKA